MRKHTIIVIILFSLLILGYLFSALFMEDNVPKPQYERYDQSNRLDKIRKGFQKK